MLSMALVEVGQGWEEDGVDLVVGPTDIDRIGDGVVPIGEVLALALGALTTNQVTPMPVVEWHPLRNINRPQKDL